MLCNVETTWCQSTDSGTNNLNDITVCTITGSNEALSCRPAVGGVTLSCPESSTHSPCTLKLSVSPHHIERILISSVDVLCDAKNAEIFGDHEEYIMTSRGMRVDDELDLDRQLFIMQHSFEALMARCSFRLVSPLEPNKIWIHSIYINLERSPVTTNTLPSPNLEMLSPSIDIEKVKAMLNDMDQEIPDKAKSLLAAVETFQKNRLYSVTSAVSPQASCLSADHPGQMAALMSMFNDMQMPTGSLHSSEMIHSLNKSSSSDAQGPSSVPPTNTEQNVSDNKGIENDHSDSDHNRSTEMRLEESANNNGNCKIAGDTHCATRCSNCGGPQDSMEFLPHLEKKILSSVQEAEVRILNKIEQQITAFEQRISAKFDVILSRLAVKDVADEC